MTSFPPKIVLLGGGGHARVLIELMRLSGPALPAAILDPARLESVIMGVPVKGGDEHLASVDATHFVVALGSTGDTSKRQKLFALGLSHGLEPLTLRHPDAMVSGSAKIGEGSQILVGAIVGTGAILGRNTLINSGAVVEHDCRLEDHVHVATAAKLAGGVRVGMGAHIGIGAVIRESIGIGAGSVVAAGAVVIKDVAEKTTVAGVPAVAIF